MGNIASSSVVLAKAQDPIQELFLNTAREYYKKKGASKTGLVDEGPAIQKQIKEEITKINKQFGASASGEFPAFNFEEPKLEPIAADKLEAKLAQANCRPNYSFTNNKPI